MEVLVVRSKKTIFLSTFVLDTLDASVERIDLTRANNLKAPN